MKASKTIRNCILTSQKLSCEAFSFLRSKIPLLNNQIFKRKLTVNELAARKSFTLIKNFSGKYKATKYDDAVANKNATKRVLEFL